MTIECLADLVMASDSPLFEKQKHIQYWLRCFRTPLPHQYTANDSNILALTFFTVSALDLLGILFTRTTAEERVTCIESIYAFQHSDGGFRGFLGADLGSRTTGLNKVWDPANIPATYFALSALLILGDDLSRVQKAKCLAWLRKVQRPDGSFGEMLGHDGSIKGGMDTRYGYCAMAVRWMLRGYLEGKVFGEEDVEIEQFVQCIKRSQTYDGGISEEPSHEAHAGFSYCAIASLAFLGRLPADPHKEDGDCESAHGIFQGKAAGLSSPKAVVQWLLFRLTTTIDEEDDDEDEFASLGEDNSISTATGVGEAPTIDVSADAGGRFEKLGSALASEKETSHMHSSEAVIQPSFVRWVGFSGRCNKVADTCYAFWAAGSLKMLNSLQFADATPLRRYLLAKTQHLIAGGFGKFPGDPPDIYHSYMGLASLSLLGVGFGDEAVFGPHIEDIDREEIRESLGSDTAEKLDNDSDNLRKLDAALCFSRRARLWLEGQEWRKSLTGSH